MQLKWIDLQLIVSLIGVNYGANVIPKFVQFAQ